MDIDLDKIRDLAIRYKDLVRHRENREEALAICKKMVTANALEVAYFCTELSSYATDTAQACAWLTAFTNRLTRFMELWVI